MPDDGQCELDASALQSVVAIIKDMEIKVSSLVLVLIQKCILIYGD